jgi:NADPH-dependent glutamate synthase beta subunit-like oxidoreductase
MARVRIGALGSGPSGIGAAVSFRSTRELRTGHWRTFRPERATRPSPCNLDCPVGTDVRSVLSLAAEGDVEGAWRAVMRHNPLPGVCGRVCYHPCEARCNRDVLDEPVAVHSVERALADEARRRGIAPEAGAVDPLATRVGIIGAGPAGLACAYHLARLGHAVTLMDENHAPGGMLRYGIPEYRLPRQILDDELALIERAGVTFVAGARAGAADGPDLGRYAALFLAIGAQRPVRVPVPGHQLEGVEPALHLLRDVNGGVERRLDGCVLILGGGNTAIDAARVARRIGAEPTVVYRRSREDMPAHPDEVAQAAAEGVEFVFHASPLRFIEEQGRLGAVEFQRMRPGPPDASGRRAPEPIPASTFTVTTRNVFAAIGEEVDVETLQQFAAASKGHLSADRWGRTDRPSIFAGGDAATGAGTVAEAIGSGVRAARAMDAHLRGHDLVEHGLAARVESKDLNLFYFERSPRCDPRALSQGRIGRGFEEVVPSLAWSDASREAQRCFACGACTGCDNCYVFCPDAAIVPDRAAAEYEIDLTHCKGCGVCAAECPRGALTLVPEEQQPLTPPSPLGEREHKRP